MLLEHHDNRRSFRSKSVWNLLRSWNARSKVSNRTLIFSVKIYSERYFFTLLLALYCGQVCIVSVLYVVMVSGVATRVTSLKRRTDFVVGPCQISITLFSANVTGGRRNWKLRTTRVVASMVTSRSTRYSIIEWSVDWLIDLLITYDFFNVFTDLHRSQVICILPQAEVYSSSTCMFMTCIRSQVTKWVAIIYQELFID